MDFNCGQFPPKPDNPNEPDGLPEYIYIDGYEPMTLDEFENMVWDNLFYKENSRMEIYDAVEEIQNQDIYLEDLEKLLPDENEVIRHEDIIPDLMNDYRPIEPDDDMLPPPELLV